MKSLEKIGVYVGLALLSFVLIFGMFYYYYGYLRMPYNDVLFLSAFLSTVLVLVGTGVSIFLYQHRSHADQLAQARDAGYQDAMKLLQRTGKSYQDHQKELQTAAKMASTAVAQQQAGIIQQAQEAGAQAMLPTGSAGGKLLRL